MKVLQNHPTLPKTSLDSFHLVFTFLGSLLLLFVIAPLLSMFLASSLGDISSAAIEREVLQSISLTLTSALIATVLVTVAGVPLAYLLARKRFWGKAVVLAIVDTPIVIPHLAAGIALLGLLSRDAWVGGVMNRLGFSAIGSVTGIVIAMAFVSLPYLVNSAREGFQAAPERLEKVGRTLGASPWRVFWTISIPMAWRSIVSGMILMWARGISEFGAVIIIAYHPMTTPVLVYERYGDYGLKYARPVAVLLILICLVISVMVRFVVASRRTGDQTRRV